MIRADRRALGILTLLMLTLALPFVRRAYFVDDFYFVTMAKGILEHPLRPYDFRSDDAGLANVAWERGQAPRMVNPPLFHYFLAVVMKVWGDAVWKLRTATLIFPLLSLYAAYFLGKRFVKNSLSATSLLAITPAFWLTSYSLLIDSALLAFCLAALECFIVAHEKKHAGLWVLSGLLMGAALLTKYTGFLILPLVLGWHALNWNRCSLKGTAMAVGVCAGVFVVWGLWGIATYGQMHFTATLSRGFHSASSVGTACLLLCITGIFVRWRWPSNRRAMMMAWVSWGLCLVLAVRVLADGSSLGAWIQTFYLDKFIGVSSFLGGSTVFLFFTPILLGLRNKPALVAWAAAVVLCYVWFGSRFGGFDTLQSATLAFFIGSTLAFLILLCLNVAPTSGRLPLFLGGWVLMGLLELVLVMPWTAARYMLLVLPPVCWLFRKWVEDKGHRRLWYTAWGTTALMGLALATVDFAQAGVVFPLEQTLESQQPLFESMAPRPARHWYSLSDTFDGTQYYVRRLGWESVFPSQQLERGGLFLRSYYRKSSWWNVRDPERFQPIMMWEFNNWIPLRVMDVPASAGFYASVWGILPYAITRHPLERFELYLVK